MTCRLEPLAAVRAFDLGHFDDSASPYDPLLNHHETVVLFQGSRQSARLLGVNHAPPLNDASPIMPRPISSAVPGSGTTVTVPIVPEEKKC